MKDQTMLEQIDLGCTALPESQRGYVSNGDGVGSLMHSLHPIRCITIECISGMWRWNL